MKLKCITITLLSLLLHSCYYGDLFEETYHSPPPRHAPPRHVPSHDPHPHNTHSHPHHNGSNYHYERHPRHTAPACTTCHHNHKRPHHNYKRPHHKPHVPYRHHTPYKPKLHPEHKKELQEKLREKINNN